ncbi:hypothetical protein [Fulvivirga sedimenti]|uniref:Protein SirB1 N-terminal domain-containing protein n=1 Tax=Fulvivirga sedimenti TaxID=2879465 RepID=A0A9X1KZT2_9BACT|nr:hypothetical protein [Fulvivirga sedimenti]MCA6078635.1 hypothetical protein [Fulvivirga sedimenti]
MASETERQLIWKAYTESGADLFSLNAAANSTLPITAIESYKSGLAAFTSELRESYAKHNNTQYLLKTLFYKTHKKYLHQYKSNTSFGNLLETGNYDCLSGTILYGWLLHELGFDYSVIETEHHIYLVINSEQGDFMFESTDPLNGFIYTTAEMEARLSKLSENEAGVETFKPVNNSVTFKELVGLQYFNAAVDAYNSGNFIEAVDQVEKASIFYSGDRLKELGIIISKAIVGSDLDQQTKMAYLMKLTQTLNKGVILASLN